MHRIPRRPPPPCGVPRCSPSIREPTSWPRERTRFKRVCIMGTTGSRVQVEPVSVFAVAVGGIRPGGLFMAWQEFTSLGRAGRSAHGGKPPAYPTRGSATSLHFHPQKSNQEGAGSRLRPAPRLPRRAPRTQTVCRARRRAPEEAWVSWVREPRSESTPSPIVAPLGKKAHHGRYALSSSSARMVSRWPRAVA